MTKIYKGYLKRTEKRAAESFKGDDTKLISYSTARKKMKTFAIDFAYYDFGDQIYTIKWITAKTEEKDIDQLIKFFGNIHIQSVREINIYN